MYNKTLLNKMIKDVKKGKHTSNVAKANATQHAINIMHQKRPTYALGGYFDCPDQEKDPVTGKCSAEVARGKEAAAANKAATADMNAWAKQVAAMDKENARQDAAQYAGQRSFDYDYMQSPVDKAEKKAAMAAYKQFFQQNPNTFVPDDTSGFSPEQKYVIASKLKQKATTNLGAKAFQQKFNQDPRFYDLDRLQKDIVPMLGGWDATRNWMFNNKASGGPIVDPMGQWAHPGKVTRIPSDRITMQGVPYPVLGIGSNGHQQLMQPGGEYSFGGAEHVDEYPMMAKGGEMIRRADGHYSRRGLWDNIRANKGSGKKPTKEMLEQEHKINHMQNGGIMINDKDMDTMQFGGRPKQQPAGNRQKQIMQLVQAYAQATHGDPNQILQQLQQMQPQQMQQAIQQMSQAVQGPAPQQQPGMADGGSTYADGVWYKNGGDFGGMISPAVDYGVHAQSFAGYMQAGGSVVDYLKSIGKSSDFDSRAQMAQSMGIDNYTGTADQNLNLLSQLQSNKTPKSPLPQPKAKQPVTMKPSPYIMAPKTAVPDFYDMPTLPFSQPAKDPRALQSGVVVDKNTNTAHVIKNGKVTKSFPVLTGQSRDGENQNDYSLDYLESHPEARVTPTGNYMMGRNPNIYGQPGFNMKPIPAFGAPAPKAKAIAAHTTYPGDMARRDPLYRGPGDERNASYGCINCRKPDINYLTNQFPQGDTAVIVDSRNGNDRHYLKESYGIRHQFGGATDGAYEYGYGGMYENGGTNNPGFNALPDYVQHQILSNMAYGGIHIAPSKRGTFTAAATKHGKSVQAFASQVLANKENYSPAMVKKANFARNASKWKHQDGGPVVGHEMEVTPQEAEMLRQQGYQFEIV